MGEASGAQTYKTVSGEHIEVCAKARLVGRDSNGILKAVQGRVADRHKRLVARVEVTIADNDVWIADDAGYMMRKDHFIANALRKKFDELTRQYGFEGLTRFTRTRVPTVSIPMSMRTITPRA